MLGKVWVLSIFTLVLCSYLLACIGLPVGWVPPQKKDPEAPRYHRPHASVGCWGGKSGWKASDQPPLPALLTSHTEEDLIQARHACRGRILLEGPSGHLMMCRNLQSVVVFPMGGCVQPVSRTELLGADLWLGGLRWQEEIGELENVGGNGTTKNIPSP